MGDIEKRVVWEINFISVFLCIQFILFFADCLLAFLFLLILLLLLSVKQHFIIFIYYIHEEAQIIIEAKKKTSILRGIFCVMKMITAMVQFFPLSLTKGADQWCKKDYDDHQIINFITTTIYV